MTTKLEKLKTLLRRFIERHTLKVNPIKTADIMTFVCKTRPVLKNSYDAIDKIYEVDMTSGKVALFKCVNYERAWNVDWGWYYLIFWGYK